MQRVAIVTGSASGIGRAAAERFAASGLGVVAGDVRLPTGLPAGVVCLEADVATASGNAALVEAALERFGRLDTAVLNAGVAGSRPFEQAGMLEQFDHVMDVNVRGVVLGLQAVLVPMVAAGSGSIVITASVSGLGGDPGMWAYNTSKGAVINLMRATAIDYAARGIRVNAVCPGPTHTGMTAPVRETRPDWYEGLRSRVPMQRWGEADEIAAVIEFLASSAASFVTGVAIAVDGGVTAGTGQFTPPSA